MAKSIQERVRATLAKAEKAAQRSADRAHDARMSKLEKADVAADARIEGLMNGTIEPRNLREWQIAAGEGLE